MNHQQTVTAALDCLEALDETSSHAISTAELGRRLGIAAPACEEILRRLAKAGIVALGQAGRVALVRELTALTALELLQALWATSGMPGAARMLVGQDAQRRDATLRIVRAMCLPGRENLNG